MAEGKDVEYGPVSGVPKGKILIQQTAGHKEKKTGLTRKGVATIVAASAVGGVAAEATLHPIENATGMIQEAKEAYEIGQVINPDKVYEVNVVNSFDKEGNIVEPMALVTINGEVREVPLNDPNLKGLSRDALRGLIRVDQGEYKLADLGNPDYKQNLAMGFDLPSDIGAHFNRLPVKEGSEPRALYFEPIGAMYTLNGREFPVRLPLSAVQPPLST